MILLKFLFVLFGLLAESEQFKADSHAFLFTLVAPDGNGPQKMSLSPGVNGGIQCDRNWGPSFGLNKYRYGIGSRCDLRFLVQCNKFIGHFNFGGGFECPSNMDRWRSYPSADGDLSINELEVFQVKF